MRFARSAAASILFLTLVAGCEAGASKPMPAVKELPSAAVTLAGHAFTLEIADDFQKRETGLMYRTTMPADHGMLFAFPDVDGREFWMKNTLIPLDIAYLDADGIVLNVAQMYPHDLTGVASAGPAKYAIELNQGVAAQVGLKAGDKVVLPKTDPK